MACLGIPHAPFIAAVLASCMAITLRAQTSRDSNALGWFAYIGDHDVAGDWQLHVEGQWRRSEVVLGWQQLLLRPAMTYRINRSWSAGAGYVYSRTYPYGAFPDPFATPEHRAFEQLSAEHSIGKWDLSHRIRLEQRFLGQLPDPPSPVVDRWRYRNRIRYELSTQRSLSKAFYLVASVEPNVRIGVNYRGRALDQIQSFIAIGRHIRQNWRVETGYSHQYGVPRTGTVFESNHTLQLRVRSSSSLAGLFRPAKTADR